MACFAIRMEAHPLCVVHAKRAFQALPEPSGVERAANDDGAAHVVFGGGSVQQSVQIDGLLRECEGVHVQELRMAHRISGSGTGWLS